jgi:hypothetical protein
LVRLDNDRHRDHELAAEPRDELGGDSVGVVTAVGRREQRSGVCDDLQRAVTSSLR